MAGLNLLLYHCREDDTVSEKEEYVIQQPVTSR